MMIRLTASMLLLLALAACGGAPRADAGEGAPVAVPPVAEGRALTAAPPTDEPATLAEPGEVDYGCEVDDDCEVKNVGNCCGYYPACVNRASETFPEQVQARCRASGEMSICGFAEIQQCRCNAGRCEAADAGNALR
jgi:hypothetical protein